MPGPKPIFSAEECSALLKEYDSGKSLKALAELHGVSYITIRRALEKAGVTYRPRGNRSRRV